MNVRVTFRDNDDFLTSLMVEHFKSIADAKRAIEFDAKVFLDAHNHVSKHDAYCGVNRRARAKWYDTKKLDYYKAVAKDGATCYWQYFTED